jgi:hypothetical protein
MSGHEGAGCFVARISGRGPPPHRDVARPALRTSLVPSPALRSSQEDDSVVVYCPSGAEALTLSRARPGEPLPELHDTASAAVAPPPQQSQQRPPISSNGHSAAGAAAAAAEADGAVPEPAASSSSAAAAEGGSGSGKAGPSGGMPSLPPRRNRIDATKVGAGGAAGALRGAGTAAELGGSALAQHASCTMCFAELCCVSDPPSFARR